jgi:hypothetical protein
MNRMARFAPILALCVAPLARADAGELGGSLSSMRHQHAVANRQHVAFLRTPADVQEQVGRGTLVPIDANDHLVIDGASYPFARPSLALFIQRLSAQYRSATGQQLVVTSLTRPTTQQPRNAHRLSVHPAGLAVDFRLPSDAAHRAWLEETLLSLEKRGVLDVTRERNPPHYHVAVFPEQYERYAAPLIASERAAFVADSLRVAAQQRAADDLRASNQELPRVPLLPLAGVLLTVILFGARPSGKFSGFRSARGSSR